MLHCRVVLDHGLDGPGSIIIYMYIYKLYPVEDNTPVSHSWPCGPGPHFFPNLSENGHTISCPETRNYGNDY